MEQYCNNSEGMGQGVPDWDLDFEKHGDMYTKLVVYRYAHPWMER
jgi:hypothetical protein